VLNISKPKTKKGIIRLLGLVKLIAKFISNLATLIVDLTKLRRKNSKWNWNKIHDKAFEQLKHAISHVQLLRHPKQNEHIIVQCDASNEAVCAALLQNHDGILVPIEFISKQFDSHQLKWHTSDKVTICIVIRNSKMDALSIIAWALQLSEFSFEARYFPGSENSIADFLSRNPKSLESVEKLLVITRSHFKKNINAKSYDKIQNTSDMVANQIDNAFDMNRELHDYDELFEKNKFREAQESDTILNIIKNIIMNKKDYHHAQNT
ncbi:hypothetical protein RFI_31631, partial [Reticulomyxa filosa]